MIIEYIFFLYPILKHSRLQSAQALFEQDDVSLTFDTSIEQKISETKQDKCKAITKTCKWKVKQVRPCAYKTVSRSTQSIMDFVIFINTNV